MKNIESHHKIAETELLETSVPIVISVTCRVISVCTAHIAKV